MIAVGNDMLWVIAVGTMSFEVIAVGTMSFGKEKLERCRFR